MGLQTQIKRYPGRSGQSLIEILIAIGLTAIILPGLLTGFVASREGKAQEAQRLQAVALLRETEEAVRSARNNSWANIPSEGTYHPVVSGNSWILSPGAETIGSHTRTVTISNVQRNTNGEIVTSGGIVDPSTKSIDSTVTWSAPISSSVSSTNLFHRFVENTAWTQTSSADFNAGITSNTVVVNNSGGEVELATGSGGNWASPTQVGSFNANGNVDGLSSYADGNYLYLATVNAGAENDLNIIDITNPSLPSLIGGINLNATVSSVYVSGNFAYLATSGDASELTVINVSNKSSPTIASTVNLGGIQDAYAVYASGSYVYIGKQAGSGANRELYVVNITNPLSPSQAGSLEVGADVNNLHIIGNYAYMATDHNSRELTIIDITNPSSPTIAGSYNAPSSSNGEGIYAQGSAAYLTTADNASGAEFYIINTTNPTSPSLTGSINLGQQANDTHISGIYAIVATENSSQEFQVLDISNSSSPTLYGSLNLNGSAKHAFIVGDYAYISNLDDNAEMVVVEGGSGSVYTTSGMFESSTFDAGSEVAFNYLDFAIVEPPGSNVSTEVAINSDNSTWNYFGAFVNHAAIPLTNINGRYIRYRTTLSGNGSSTPSLNAVSVNYSP